MAIYTIEPERSTLHGQFSREFPPVLTIDPGDTVRFRTLDAGWGLEPHVALGTPRRRFEPRIEGRDNGHALCGPVAIRGAQPGIALEVQINEVRPGPWGWTQGGGWVSEVNRRLGVAEQGILLTWTLDTNAMVGRNQYDHTITLRPFMGVMGMPPDEAGMHSTAPPRTCGGNIDCKELVAGSTLYLPIAVPEALFSVGDGHAAQADGEASSTGIECPMERVDLTFRLRDDLRLTTPRAKTPAGWITFGFHKDLNEATILALDAMLNLMGELYHLPRPEALAMASLVVDLRITQIVNGVCGVHAVLPYGAMK
ncbi:MAG: acetamidase/formamidase family protein [Candidatus Tectomicrobia bacterium]|nr:acetamidase/formamidase family protein [Candidatus Tectomicrobia bacterium]